MSEIIDVDDMMREARSSVTFHQHDANGEAERHRPRAGSQMSRSFRQPGKFAERSLSRPYDGGKCESRRSKALSAFPRTVEEALAGGLEALSERVKAEYADQNPECEIRFQNLKYTADVVVGGQQKATVGGALRSMLCFCKAKRVAEKRVLHNVSGVLKPRTMTLVLGPPGSGKSSLLKALAGRLNGQKGLSGKVLINGRQHHAEMQLQNFVSFVGQDDVHEARLTVAETLEFALHCSSMEHKAGMTDEELHQRKQLKLEVVLKILGLDGVRDTVVGDALLRGISGGQRKRVTVGEILITGRPSCLMDEISTGLDSATTYDIIKALQVFSHSLNKTFAVSLLQPTPEVFALFDDVILMSQGQIAYHGPRERVMHYFFDIGFTIPFQKDRADFLQEVTTPDGARYIRPGFKAPPRNPEEFATRFKHSEIYAQTKEILSKPSEQVVFSDEVDRGMFARPFPHTFWGNTMLLLKRERNLTLRDRTFLRARMGQMVLMGILAGTIYYQMPLADFNLRYGVMFLVTMLLALGSMAQVPVVMKRRKVFYKQRAAGFFRVSSFALSQSLVSVPIAIAETIVLTSLVYWLTGWAPDAGRFFTALLILFWTNLGMGAWFRLLGFLLKDESSGPAVAGVSTVVFVLFGGFLITADAVKAWWLWAYWASPLSWVIRSLAINEFKHSSFDAPAGSPAGTPRPGDLYLLAFDMKTDAAYVWYGLMYLLFFFVLVSVLSFLVLTNIEHISVQAASNSDLDADAEDFGDALAVNVRPGRKKQLDFTPTTLTFSNVSYSVPIKGERSELSLLAGVSGFAEPSKLIALMGESGAGKTTLMDVLAARKTGGTTAGAIRINGFDQDKSSFGRVCGYVEQMDLHTPTSTVREALQFSAALRLPRDVSDERKEVFVREMLELLELEPIADSLIGVVGEGLSTEQRKRVTIGVELVTNPRILFLDEPTSGLDSRAATVIMRALRRIANSGRTIVCTIHQPSGEIFSEFDQLLLLQRGGKVVYFGDLGEDSVELVDYLESIPGTEPLTEGTNPANWMLDVIADGASNKTDYSVVYAQSMLAHQNEERLEKLTQSRPGAKMLVFEHEFAATGQAQFQALVKRTFISYWRSPSYNFLRMMILLGMAVVIGSIYYQLEADTQGGLQSRISAIFFTTLFCGIIHQNTVMPFVEQARAVFYRERAASAYAVGPYAMSMVLVELPYIACNTLLFVPVFYYMVGLRGDFDAFLYYTLLFFVYMLMSTVFGQFLSVVLPSSQVANLVGSALISIWNLFAGFVIPYPAMPAFWQWVYWLDPIHYVLEGMLGSEFHCPDGADCPTVVVTTADGTVEVTAQGFVDQQYGWNYDARWRSVIVLVAITVVLRVGTYLGLKYISHLKR